MENITTENAQTDNLELFVWRTGLAEISKKAPIGSELIVSGSREFLESLLVHCRLIKDGSNKYLVSGIPEARTEKEALEACARFRQICENVQQGKEAFEGVGN